MTPQCFACYHLVVFPPLLFCFFLYPTSTPTVSPTAFTGGYSSKVDEPFFFFFFFFLKVVLQLAEKKRTGAGGWHTKTGVKALGWMLHSSTVLYFPIHSAVWCQDCCEFSHPQDMSYTATVHWTPEEEKEEEVVEEVEWEEGEENRTCRWKGESWWRGGTVWFISEKKAT